MLTVVGIRSYLRMMATATSGGQVINYSGRFTISGMTGSWSSTAAETAYKAISGTAGPPTQNQVNAGGAAGGAQGGDYTVSYEFQTGLTKYAPMQTQPGTKITAKNTSPLYPTSPWTVATTYLPEPSQVTTMTASATYTMTTIENTVGPTNLFNHTLLN